MRILGLRACPASTRLGIVQAEGVISTGPRFNPVGHLFNARRAIIVVATVDGRYVTSFRDDLTRDTLTVNFRIPRRHLLHELQAAHPPPLPQARREEEGLHEDAAKLSGHRGVDNDRSVQLPGWLDPGAGPRDALPPLITSRGERRRPFPHPRQSWSRGQWRGEVIALGHALTQTPSIGVPSELSAGPAARILSSSRNATDGALCATRRKAGASGFDCGAGAEIDDVIHRYGGFVPI